MNYCFLNGQILPLSEAKVSINDIGLLRGYGIYDGLAVFGGKPFRFADHFKRFLDGAHALNLNIPITEEKAEKVIIEIAEKSGLSSPRSRANVRMILTGGDTIGGIEYDFDKPTFYIIIEKFEPLPKELYEKGAKLITYRYKRELPEHKTINYITAVNLQNYKKDQGAVEILYTYDGEVLECSTSNIFLIKDNKLITPLDGVLEGITKKVVLEIAKQEGIEIEERMVYEEELAKADEVFITSSFKDIVPIVKIDDFAVGGGNVGEMTKKLMLKFEQYIANFS